MHKIRLDPKGYNETYKLGMKNVASRKAESKLVHIKPKVLNSP